MKAVFIGAKKNNVPIACTVLASICKQLFATNALLCIAK